MRYLMNDENKSMKGKFGGNCNRTSCQKPGATWFNHSTLMYYCEECAILINDCNRVESVELLGHDLCCNHELEGVPYVEVII